MPGFKISLPSMLRDMYSVANIYCIVVLIAVDRKKLRGGGGIDLGHYFGDERTKSINIHTAKPIIKKKEREGHSQTNKEWL